jgi:hypothetical protein
MTSPEQRKTILEEMESALGRPPTVDELIASASDPEHPLHGDFEWSDTECGQNWRRMQARALMRSVLVITVTKERTIQSVAYVRNPLIGHHQGYVNVKSVQRRSAEARTILDMLVRHIRARVETAREVAAVLGLEHELEILLEQLLVIQRKLTAQQQRKSGRQKAQT